MMGVTQFVRSDSLQNLVFKNHFVFRPKTCAFYCLVEIWIVATDTQSCERNAFQRSE